MRWPPLDTDQVAQGRRGGAPDQAAAGQWREAEGGHREAEQEDGQRVGQVLEHRDDNVMSGMGASSTCSTDM